jgi:hypothetical protein
VDGRRHNSARRGGRATPLSSDTNPTAKNDIRLQSIRFRRRGCNLNGATQWHVHFGDFGVW